MKFGRFRMLLWLCLCGAAALTGCGGDAKATGPLLPVKGRVTLGGRPLVGGVVTFFPFDRDAKGPQPTGDINAQGYYSLKTGTEDGAPAGKYRATVTTSGDDKTQEQQFNSLYSSWQNSPLVVEVMENTSAAGYDLKLAAKGRR